MRKNLHWNSKIYDKYMYLIIIDKVLVPSSWTLMCLKSSEYLWILCERCFSEGCVVRSSSHRKHGKHRKNALRGVREGVLYGQK